ncbi:MAG: hypothetical protein ACI9JN_001862 [Bacteroidia bacterium]|jgi:hypothetical protein
MILNFPILLLAALAPMVIGFIWYNPKVFGKAWMEASGMTDEKVKGGNMVLIFGLSFVLAVLLAFALNGMVIHQNHLYSIFFGQKDALNQTIEYLNANQSGWDLNWRDFRHGSIHGFFGGLFFAIPVLITNALFERKGMKYALVNGGYWIVTLTLMGGVICQFS